MRRNDVSLPADRPVWKENPRGPTHATARPRLGCLPQRPVFAHTGGSRQGPSPAAALRGEAPEAFKSQLVAEPKGSIKNRENSVWLA